MSPGLGNKLKLLFILFIGVNISVIAASTTIDIENEDNQIWLHSETDTKLEGTISCSQNYPNLTSFSLEGPQDFFGVNKPESSGDSFSYNFDLDATPGESYKVSSTCENSSSNDYSNDTASFSVYSLDVDRKSPSSSDKDLERYRGEKLTTDLEVKVKGSSGGVFNPEDADPLVNLLGEESVALANKRVSVSGSGNTYDLGVEGEIPEEISTGPKSLEAGLTYSLSGQNDITVREDDFVTIEVLEPWSFNVINRTPESAIINYENVPDLSVETQIYYKGEPKQGLTSDDFYLTVRDGKGEVIQGLDEKKWITSEPLNPSSGKYRLKLKEIPGLDIGKYRYTIGLDRKDGRKIVELPVYNYMFFSGEILDATGKSINADILVERGVNQKRFEMEDGKYRGKVLPGDYNFTVEFPQLSARFEGVKLEKGVQGNIRYDEIPIKELSDDFEGISVLNSIGLIFGYPLQSASMEMSYDPSDASFEKVKVLECQEWNFQQRNCFSDWEEVNSSRVKIYPTVGRVEFEGTPLNVSSTRSKILSGYMIVRNTQLRPEYLNMDMGRYKVDESANLEGKIVTPRGQGVQDVDVNVSVINGERIVESVNANTQSAGTFGVQVPVPDEPSTYTVKVSAEKDPYEGFSKELSGTIDAYVQRDISVKVPESVEFYPGENAETRFTVINDGQEPAEDVKIRIEGLNTDWYDFAEGQWNSIGPGGSRQAVMNTQLPQGYCGDQCTEYPTFQVEAIAQSGGESINDIQNVQSVVKKEPDSEVSQSSETSASSNQSDSDSSMMPELNSVTGDFLERKSSLNIALGLIAVFILSLAVAIKRKKGDAGDIRGRATGGSSRGSVSKGSADSRVTRPDVSSGGKEGGVAEKEDEEQVEEQETGEHVCSVCGEEFDTDSGLELHEQAMH